MFARQLAFPKVRVFFYYCSYRHAVKPLLIHRRETGLLPSGLSV